MDLKKDEGDTEVSLFGNFDYIFIKDDMHLYNDLFNTPLDREDMKNIGCLDIKVYKDTSIVNRYRTIAEAFSVNVNTTKGMFRCDYCHYDLSKDVIMSMQIRGITVKTLETILINCIENSINEFYSIDNYIKYVNETLLVGKHIQLNQIVKSGSSSRGRWTKDSGATTIVDPEVKNCNLKHSKKLLIDTNESLQKEIDKLNLDYKNLVKKKSGLNRSISRADLELSDLIKKHKELCSTIYNKEGEIRSLKMELSQTQANLNTTVDNVYDEPLRKLEEGYSSNLNPYLLAIIMLLIFNTIFLLTHFC